MAGIVGIHGIGQQFRGGYQLGAEWYQSIRDGLAAASYQSVADALPVTDVRVAFFGDLFHKPGSMAGSGPPASAKDLQPGPERELLRTFYEAAVVQDPSLGSAEGSMGAGKAAVQVMLNRLARSKTFAGITERAFVGNLKQVTAFLTNPIIKQNVLARVREQIGEDTRIVIGHSLGSVVAYEYLCHERPSAVELLVTLGCPLGIPNVVFDKLSPPPVDGAGGWPGSVPAWVNVADPNDVVALRKSLAPLFPGTSPGQAVADRLVDNGKWPHDANRYLIARQTGSALGDVLR
jgi:hypothetical protein